MSINQKAIKEIFRDGDVQLNKDALRLVERTLLYKVKSIVSKCRDNNIKRLKPELYHYVSNT